MHVHGDIAGIPAGIPENFPGYPYFFEDFFLENSQKSGISDMPCKYAKQFCLTSDYIAFDTKDMTSSLAAEGLIRAVLKKCVLSGVLFGDRQMPLNIPGEISETPGSGRQMKNHSRVVV